MSRDRCKTRVPLMWSGGCSSDAPFLPSILQPVNPECPSTPQLPSLLPFHLSASSLPSPPKSTLLLKEVHRVPAQVSKGVCCSSCCPATSKVLILITSHKKREKPNPFLHWRSLSPLTSQNKGIFLEQKLQGMGRVEGFFTCFTSLLFKKCFMQLSETKMRILVFFF